MTYHPQLITHEYDFSPMTMSYHLWLSYMTIMSYVSWLWHLSHITSHDHDCYSSIWPSSLLSHKTMTIHTWTPHMSMFIITDSHHPDDPLFMTIMTHNYHLWPWLMTIIYDLSHLWISGLSPISTTYDHHDLWLSLVTHRLITNDNASHPWPITCHSWLCLLTLTYDHHLSPMTYDLWHMTMIYDHHLSPLTTTYHP